MSFTHNDVLNLLTQLIKIPSFTPVEAKHSPAASQTLDILEQWLIKSGAQCTRLTFKGGHKKWGYPVDNLYVEWTFGKPNYHLCFLGHTDVVPVGDASGWSVDPFAATQKDGWLYGRGTTDMKGAIAAYAVAVQGLVKQLEAESNCTNLRISMVITTDEEWAAINGTDKVLAWMKDNLRTPNAFLIGEPSSQNTLGSHIKIGRRGSLCGTLTATGVQGHAAYSDLFVNPNRALCLATSILQTHQFSDQKANFPASQFEIIALNSGDFNATAIIPGQARALWNSRFTPDYTPQDILDLLNQIIANPPKWAQQHPDFHLLAKVQIEANIDTASQPYYSVPNTLAKLASTSIQEAVGTKPVLDGSGGATDGRFIHTYFPKAEIIELGLPEKGGMCLGHQAEDYGTVGGMHQVDERCLLSDLYGLHDIYRLLLKSLSNKAPSAPQDASTRQKPCNHHSYPEKI